MDKSSVRSICGALAAEPLFHLSLHSKELFHSNLVGWFCETHPDAASRVFRRWVPSRTGAATVVVQRERGHLDLAVELPGLAPFVIENKVFAPPDDSQLDAYAAGRLAGLTDPTLLLLSLGRPAWDGDAYRSPSGLAWRHVSYAELARSVEEAVSDITGFDRDVLIHYGAFISNLHWLGEVAGQVGDDESIAVDDETATLLRAVRLHDGIGKLRARVAIAAARAFSTPLLRDHNIRWEAGFTNGLPLVEAFLDRGDGDWLGWQYQGGQWRLAVIATNHRGRTEDIRRARHAYVAEWYAAWFDFTPIRERTGRQVDSVGPTEARGAFNGYNPDFVYRYRKLPGLTRSELVALSHYYLSAAASWAA